MLHWGPGRRFVRWAPSSVAVDADAATLIAAMTVPPDAPRQALINQTILSLKSASIWTKLDVVYMLAAHDAQAARLNWKLPASHALTATNSPTFTIDRGYQGNGTSSFLQTNTYNPTTFLGAFTLNVAVYGGWLHLASTIVSTLDFYMGNSRLGNNTNNTIYQGRLNDGTSFSGPAPAAAHWAIRRASATDRTGWKNGSIFTTDAIAATTLSNNLTLLATGGASFSNSRVSAAYAGGGFSDADMAAMHTILNTYMTAVGVV